MLPTAIVLTNGILPVTVVTAYTIWPELADIVRLSEFTMTFADWDSMWIGVGLSFAVQLVAWWFDAAVMYLVSVGGSGDYSRLLAYTGWGYLPFVLLTVVETVAIAALAAVGVLDGLSVVFSVLAAVFLVWAGYIWVFAVRAGRNVALWRAFVAAIVTATLYYWGWYSFG